MKQETAGKEKEKLILNFMRVIEIYFTYHEIDQFEVYNLVIFSIFTILSNYYYYRKINFSSQYSHLPSFPTLSNHKSTSYIDLPFMNLSY
jgi:hypothetical protein